MKNGRNQVHLYCTNRHIDKYYNKLSYRRGTVRRAVSVKTVLNVAQMFVELHLISPASRE